MSNKWIGSSRSPATSPTVTAESRPARTNTPTNYWCCNGPAGRRTPSSTTPSTSQHSTKTWTASGELRTLRHTWLLRRGPRCGAQHSARAPPGRSDACGRPDPQGQGLGRMLLQHVDPQAPPSTRRLWPFTGKRSVANIHIPASTTTPPQTATNLCPTCRTPSAREAELPTPAPCLVHLPATDAAPSSRQAGALLASHPTGILEPIA